MDIVITLPKEHPAVQELMYINGRRVRIWHIRKVLNKLLVGDRVYFVDGGYVTYYHIFIGFINDPICAFTYTMRRGLYLMLQEQCVVVKTCQKMKSFQGAHYIDRID